MSGGARRVRGFVSALAACFALTLANPGVAPAQDPQSAGADLAHSPDFRLRVQAALYLGRAKPDGARPMLERALDDGHPAVRTAAAAALAALGDSAAVPALKTHAKTETSGAARAQMNASVAALQGSVAPPPKVPVRARYVVEIGQMRNMTSVRGAELSNVLRDAARAQAEALPGAVVFDAGDPDADRAAARMPVLLLDGSITRMTTTASSGTMRVDARVEFSVRRVPQQTLKGTLSGGATATESMRTVSTKRLTELEDQTVGNAVESAMRGADHGLALAAR
jgi:hypothetical protein